MTVPVSKLLADLDSSQHEAITSKVNPLAILAGAGSGKTRVLTRRIGYRVAEDKVDPDRIMAVTFTRKAAGELRERLRRLGIRDSITTGTFHSIAYAQLHERWTQHNIRPPEMIKGKFGWIARLLGRNAQRSLIADTLHELEWITARNLSFEQYQQLVDQEQRKAPVEVGRLKEIALGYRKAKLERRVIDFDDLLLLALRDMNRDANYASILNWRHRHIFVDEFQDVNPLQLELLKKWCGPEPDLCVVGDPNQAIYAWNGADSWPLRNFERYFQGGGVVKLGYNYRSTPEIVNAGHSVLPRPDREADPPKTVQPDGDEPTIRCYDSDQLEAAGIARSLRDSVGPERAWSRQAVLVRTNAQIPVIAAALKSAGITHRVRGQAQLTEQAEVKDILRWLERSPLLLVDTLKDISSAIEEAKESDDTDSVLGADRQRNREALLAIASDHATSHPDTKANEFVRWLYATAAREAIEASANAVEIMTFHSAKGLEWDRVYIAGTELGYLPIAQAKGPAALSEERRLFHVAITRARTHVNISWAKERTFGTKAQRRQPSPYLNHFDKDDTDNQTAQYFAEQNRKLARRERKAQLVNNANVTPESQKRREWLIEWRKQRSIRDGVPAYVVFNNVTVDALSVANPDTEEELYSIPGLGEKRVAKYGTEILQILQGQTPGDE